MNEDKNTSINIKRLRLQEITFPSNILVIGPSVSRKNATMIKLLDLIDCSAVSTAVITCKDTISFYDDIKTDKMQFFLPDNIDYDAVRNANCRMIEGLASDEIDFSLFEKNRKLLTVIGLQSLSPDISRSIFRYVDYVFLFGDQNNQKSLRRLWSDYGNSFIKFRDFTDIYMACTDEGDRYCDDFMVVKRLSQQTPFSVADTIFWSTLRKEASKTVSIDVQPELILNIVHTAEEVKLEHPSLSNEETQSNLKEETQSDTREPRDECVIL